MRLGFCNRIQQALLALGAGLTLILPACTPAAPTTPPPTPTATQIPTATPTATPTPTPTPIPPLQVAVHLPAKVSALPPAIIEADVIPPPGIRPSIVVTAEVMQPGFAPYATFNLFFQSANHYASTTPLQLPLNPVPGDWMVILHVQSDIPVRGKRAATFRALPPPTRILSDILPSAVTMLVPEAFLELEAQGDSWAGGRIWRSCERKDNVSCASVGDVELWWAPGPTEPLALDTAQVMLAATFNADQPPIVAPAQETTWEERSAFLFLEQWPGRRGRKAETWVIQGDNHWLYVLRLRAVSDDGVPDLVRQVGESFHFVTEN